jgi:hypothetical protein
MQVFAALDFRSRMRSACPARNNIAAAVLSAACGMGSFLSASAEENASKSSATETVAVETVKLTIHPKGETKPSLKIQLLPDPTDQLEGNAAVYYLKAMGFLEQNTARDRLSELKKKGEERAKAEGKNAMDFPPYSYLELRPEEYPKEEVREYLNLHAFQVTSLREARRFRDFSMHRNLQLSDNPIGYLLPEMQAIRELARNQRIRCRLAIAENRIDDAIEIIGQQVTMSRHIGMDDFLVSYLVGCAVLGIAIEDTMLLQEHAECPNLYWAFAQLPNPLLDSTRCLAFERQFIYLQVPKLKEVGTDVKSPAYWTEFVADFSKRTSDIDQYNEGTEITIVSKVQGEKRMESIQESIAANVPQAKQYLLDRGILTMESMEAYPKEQLVFLAMKDYYEVSRDEQFKWFYSPYEVNQGKFSIVNEKMKTDIEKFGWFAGLSHGLLPSIDVFHTAVVRTRQRIALVQALEAIRMAGADNSGKLIDSLDKAPLPIPNDPFTGKPFSYQVTGDVAVLSSDLPTHAPVRIELQFAK